MHKEFWLIWLYYLSSCFHNWSLCLQVSSEEKRVRIFCASSRAPSPLLLCGFACGHQRTMGGQSDAATMRQMREGGAEGGKKDRQGQSENQLYRIFILFFGLELRNCGSPQEILQLDLYEAGSEGNHIPNPFTVNHGKCSSKASLSRGPFSFFFSWFGFWLDFTNTKTSMTIILNILFPYINNWQYCDTIFLIIILNIPYLLI